MYSLIQKYKLILPIILLVFVLASCQKGGEPIPFSNGVSIDDIEQQNETSTKNKNNKGGSVERDDSNTEIIGGDDNEDDDGIDIIGGDDNEDEDDNDAHGNTSGGSSEVGSDFNIQFP